MSRRFRGISEPESSYDAVVIGAGVGGLTCANLLAQARMRVLLIEQHFLVGGYCSTFRRSGYTFDAATHFYPLLGNPSTITGALLSDLGVNTEWIKMDPVDCFHFPDGSRFSVPADFASYVRKLKGEFPGETDNIDRFFTLVRGAYLNGLMRYFRNVASERMAPYQDLTIRDVLNSYFRSEKLKLLLTGDIGHWGSTPSRTSFVFDSMLRLAYFLGNFYPRGGSQAFVDELARRFEEAGGHILMRSTVRRILTSNGEACGVEVETGSPRTRVVKRVHAGVVVSNADLHETVNQLIGSERVDAECLLQINKLRPTMPCFLLHLGLKDIALEELRLLEGYHWSSWDPENVSTNAFKVFLPTAFDPALAPPGGQIAIIQKVTDVDFKTTTDWPEHKRLIEEQILTSLEQCLCGFSRHIVVKLSASAQTSYRYTLNHHGAMLGWEMSPDQLGDNRPAVTGPLKNLYFVGHWTQPGGGITPVMISAMQTARLITGNARERSAARVESSLTHDPFGAPA